MPLGAIAIEIINAHNKLWRINSNRHLIDFPAKQSRTVFPWVGTSNYSDRLPSRNCKVVTTRCSVGTGSGNTGFISALTKGMDTQ